jgi:hypothetical protein
VPDATLLVGDRAEVVVDRRSRFLAVLPSFLPERAPPGVVTADPPRGPASHRLTGLTSLVGEETMPELWVILVGVKERVRAMGLHDLTLGDGVDQPPVVGLAGELQYPARHRDRDSVCGELFHERVEPFPGRFACDRYAAARRNTSTSCSRSRIRFRNSRFSADSVRD